MKVGEQGKRRKLALFATLAAAFGVFLSFGAGSASAAAACSVFANSAEIYLLGDTAVVTKGNLSHINVNGVWCDGSATTSNTTYIQVHGDGASDTLVIDLSGGDFEPGAETPDTLDDVSTTGSRTR